MTRDNLKKQSKVIDMMVTAHSILAFRYKMRAQLFELLMLGLSTMLVALTFLDPDMLRLLKVDENSAKIFLGCISTLVFFMSIAALVLDWKGLSAQHRQAFATLVSLKSEYREVLGIEDNCTVDSINGLLRKSSLVLSNLIPIPDGEFNKLKSIHLKKVLLSKFISVHPESLLFIARIRLWIHGIKKGFNSNLEDALK